MVYFFKVKQYVGTRFEKGHVSPKYKYWKHLVDYDM